MGYINDQEIMHRFQYYTLQLEEHLNEHNDIESCINDLPCMVVISRPESIDLLYTNRQHQDLSGYSLEAVRSGCREFLTEVVHPDSLNFAKRFLPDFYAGRNPLQTTMFIQYARLYGNKGYSPLITFTKVPHKQSGMVIRIPVTVGEFGKLSTKMEQIIRIDRFKLRNFKRFQKLTPREVEILKLLAHGFNSTHIGEQLYISPHTVKTHRKHLNRKLELRCWRDLMRYALAFGLVKI